MSQSSSILLAHAALYNPSPFSLFHLLLCCLQDELTGLLQNGGPVYKAFVSADLQMLHLSLSPNVAQFALICVAVAVGSGWWEVCM